MVGRWLLKGLIGRCCRLPRDRVEKRSSADKISGLSAHARLWLGLEMVYKGKKRAAAPVNSQKKRRRKKQILDCWVSHDGCE